MRITRNSGPVSPFRTIGTIIYDRPCNCVGGAELLQQWFKTVVRIAFRSQDLDASPLTLENTRLRTWPLSKQLAQRPGIHIPAIWLQQPKSPRRPHLNARGPTPSPAEYQRRNQDNGGTMPEDQFLGYFPDFKLRNTINAGIAMGRNAQFLLYSPSPLSMKIPFMFAASINTWNIPSLTSWCIKFMPIKQLYYGSGVNFFAEHLFPLLNGQPVDLQLQAWSTQDKLKPAQNWVPRPM
ncbi:conserved hypothetical protein [Coccidioides posadasii str. Silveira]|uniref:Uncharacterized protein n=1 Tax=Coccidioides posadasii (strain RMSCC 757 / Silveira) TaxID=443226 RepID=E9DHT3_COCPS|nr:conserved hypothetical protein [Coccidioides posadasii str. Silveira]